MLEILHDCNILRRHLAGVTHLAVLVVNHDVVGLDIPVHDALAVAVVECLSDILLDYTSPLITVIYHTFNSSKM